MADHPLRPATRRRLGGPLPHQLADGPRAPPQAGACYAEAPFHHRTCGRSPFPLDLHGLGAPLAFALSQDQTLRENLSWPPAYKQAGRNLQSNLKRNCGALANAIQFSKNTSNKKLKQLLNLSRAFEKNFQRTKFNITQPVFLSRGLSTLLKTTPTLNFLTKNNLARKLNLTQPCKLSRG
ncbi:MAG: hypothetical protein XD55_0289, partial [Thermodesulfobacterium commune]